MPSNRIDRLATWVLVLCALAITGLLIRREFRPVGRQTARAADEERIIDDWAKYVDPIRRVGTREARVSFVVFNDYQCRACAAFSKTIAALQSSYPTQISVVHRHLPIESHQFAYRAALASECARIQGRFEQFHQGLFERQDSIGIRTWEAFAAASGVANIPAFTQCLRDSTTSRVVKSDMDAARQLRLRGTPALLLNQKLLTGAIPEEDLRVLIQSILSK